MSTMTPEQIERNRAFIRDLRANPKKAKQKMRDSDGGRCCLCVAYDTAQAMGAGLPDCNRFWPPDEIANFYGWPSREPILEYEGRRRRASQFNDGSDGATSFQELTHAEIADAFEATFPEIKV